MADDTHENISECLVRVKVDDVEVFCGQVTRGHDLFEHVTSQPGPSGWDLRGVEDRVGYSFSPRPGQRVTLVADGCVLASGMVPRIDVTQDCYWPLPQQDPADRRPSC